MEHVWYYDFPICKVGIAADAKGIYGVFFPGDKRPLRAEESQTPLLREAAGQLSAYFAGQRRTFDLPLALYGTPFQMKVWTALQGIPYGETRTYGEIAAAVGNPKASRAVGMANNRNPIAIIVPCHRVLGADSALTGYAGGLEVKRFLLELERSAGV